MMKLGIQMFSVKNMMMENPLMALKVVSEVGYKYIETAVMPPPPGQAPDLGMGFGISAGEMKRLLNDYGVKAIGSHAFFPDMEVMKARLDYQKEVGVPTIGAAASFFADEDDVKQQCELFNKVGEMSKQLGIRFYYHNHFHEFQKMNGKTVYDIMLENTDPDLVFFELDTYWAVRAGMDPVQVMDQLGKRLIMLHQKDLPADYDQPINLFDGAVDGNSKITMETFMGMFMSNPAHGQGFTEVGTGTLPIQSYIDKANKLEVEYIILEQDFTKLGEIESITYSMEAFKKYKGVE